MALANRTVGVRELKAHASEILREIQSSGEEVTITVKGKPVARLEPLATTDSSEIDGMGNSRGILKGFPELDWEDFEEVKKIWLPRPLDDE